MSLARHFRANGLFALFVFPADSFPLRKGLNHETLEIKIAKKHEQNVNKTLKLSLQAQW